MNWEAISALAEVLGVLTIIISLIYVAIQLKQNNHQLSLMLEDKRLRAFEHNVDSGLRVRQLLLLNPELMALVLKGNDDYQGLSYLEKCRYGLWLRNALTEIQGAFIRQCIVAHDPLGREGYEKSLDELFKGAGACRWVRKHLGQFDWWPEFRQLAEERLALAEGRLTESRGEAPEIPKGSG